jgi:hypothetical protein
VALGSNPAEKQENDYDEKGQSDSAGRTITPTPTVRPPWQDTQKCQNQNDDQYSYKHVVLLVMFSLGAQPLSRLHRVHRYIEMLIAIPTLGYRRLNR